VDNIDEHSTQPIKLEYAGTGADYGGQGFEMFLIQFRAGVSASLIATHTYNKIAKKSSEDPATNVEFRIDGDYNDVTIKNLRQSIQESLTDDRE
jgi:hypothetical protein